MRLIPCGIENDSPLTAHTIDVDLLTKDGWVLDAGARGFEFAEDMAKRGCQVVSLDPSRTVQEPNLPGVNFIRAALAPVCCDAFFLEEGDGSGSRIVAAPPNQVNHIHPVCGLSIERIMSDLQIKIFDAVKLDIESAEYEVLAKWPGPVARQINVAFHDFMWPPLMTKQLLEAAVKNLKRWYKPVQHLATCRHGYSTPCHWDSLFILRDLAT